jgi:hypothetical protein
MLPVIAAIAAFLLALFPVIHHLFFGLRERRREILCLFDNQSIGFYFQLFDPAQMAELKKGARTAEPKKDPARALAQLYDDRFGVRTYILPLCVYTLVLAVTIVVTVWTAFGERVPTHLPGATIAPAGAYALAGAYLWVVSDLIGRYRQRNLVPSSLYAAAFRMTIAIPLAAAVAGMLNETVAPTFGFLLGAFPTNTLMLVMRRQLSPKLGLGDDTAGQKQKHELETLQGVNTSIAETLSDIGITTLVQLAYEDPIQLAMRTNLSFYFVLDLVSQALAALYIDLAKARQYSIRGAIEAISISRTLEEGNGKELKDAKAIVAALAKKLGISEAALVMILYQVGEDPCSKFLGAIWERDNAQDKPGANSRG